MGRIIVKKIQPTMSSKKLHNHGRQSIMRSVYNNVTEPEIVKDKEEKPLTEENIISNVNEDKNNELNTDTVMMTTNEKIELANAILAEKPAPKAKRIKADKGLIERKENTIILTEDNRELLKD